MGQAYTPGLKVSELMVVRKERRLPLKGDVQVKVGDVLKAEDIIARTYLPGKISPLNLVHKMGCQPSELGEYLKVKEGDAIKKGQVLAENNGFLGIKFLKTSVKSPIEGHIEAISQVTGQMMLRGPDIPVQVDAYFDSKVTDVIEDEGCMVEATGSFIQGIFGIGGERRGEIKIVTEDTYSELTSELITEDCKGKIIVGGSYVSYDALKKAEEFGVKGIVIGGFDDSDLKRILGEDLGVAITGHEDIPFSLIITEGYGRIKMAEHTFELLKKREGMEASISGATQIRAGVMRPEIIIPVKDEKLKEVSDDSQHGEGVLAPGSLIRAIREPYFGKIGKVVNLPPELTQVDSETWVRVLQAEFQGGTKGTIPRANVELIAR
ncbi:MAG: hypothetical protein U5N86_13245 [Planctomycetota bacterium]|nr:hypothetical protein [Planctomycetota bacterium]